MANKTMSLSLASNIPTFSGADKENLNFFLDNINQVANLEKWPNSKKLLILKLNLSGKALEFVSNSPKIDNIENFEDLANLLKEKFSKKHNFADILNKFSTIQQRQNQSVTELVEEISNLTDLYVGITSHSSLETINLSEKLKAQKLIDALRGDIKLDVMKMGLTTFQEIAKAAKNIEKALNTAEVDCSNNLVKDSELTLILKNQIENNKKIQELSNRLEQQSVPKEVNNLQSTNSNVNNSNSNISCHICGKPHWTTKCWYYPRTRGNANNAFKAKSRFFRGRGSYSRSRGNSRYFRNSSNLN
jgi:hypothetical protein